MLINTFVTTIITCVILACYVGVVAVIDVEIMDYLKPGIGADLCMIMLILFQIVIPAVVLYLIFGQETESVCNCCKEVCKCVVQSNAM